MSATQFESNQAPGGEALQLRQLRKIYGPADGAGVVALQDISLSVSAGEFLAVVGPSGCGKSTFLQIVAGLLPASSGRVEVGARAVDGPPAGLVYLFQQYTKSLLPWRRVIDNVAFAVEDRADLSTAERRRYCEHYLELVGLADAAQRYPRELSGGMQQRVAIARALAAQPRVLLLDEPFSSVDALTRLELHRLMLRLWEQQRFTAVLVTHDVDEAVFLSDRIAVLSARPSRIDEVVVTGLPRPRDRITTPEQPRFLELRHYLLERLLSGVAHDR
ncbi:MAG: ABC transporter ATP-binding protein [Burkholderiaceae bacterium]